MYLLSLGVKNWQEEKVEQAGIEPFFPSGHIVYTDRIDTGKEGAMKKLFGKKIFGRKDGACQR